MPTEATFIDWWTKAPLTRDRGVQKHGTRSITRGGHLGPHGGVAEGGSSCPMVRVLHTVVSGRGRLGSPMAAWFTARDLVREIGLLWRRAASACGGAKSAIGARR